MRTQYCCPPTCWDFLTTPPGVITTGVARITLSVTQPSNAETSRYSTAFVLATSFGMRPHPRETSGILQPSCLPPPLECAQSQEA
jgi:hypothetical protein